MEANYGTIWWRHYLRISGSRCAYCLRDVGFEKLTRDHIVPKSHGGGDTPENMIPACTKCNKRKSNLRLKKFLADPKRILPAPDALPHPLGWIDGNKWVFSSEALAAQADEKARQKMCGTLRYRKPYYLLPSDWAAEIENMALPPHRSAPVLTTV
jgi:hypothetical protein